MTLPLISADRDFALWAVLIGIAGFGFWVDSTRIGKQLSGVGPDLAGILSSTYIGGSMNFAAVAEALEFNEPTLLTAALAADNVVGTCRSDDRSRCDDLRLRFFHRDHA